jgi:hypothetical protein
MVASGPGQHLIAAAVAAPGTAYATTVHGYPNVTAYDEAVTLSHLKTVGTWRYYVIELDSTGARIPAGWSPGAASSTRPAGARR